MLIRVPDQVAKPKFTVALRKVHNILDRFGLLLAITFVVSLLFALQLGSQGWSHPRVIVLFVVTGISGPAFAAWSVYRGERALLPVSILKKRHVYAATLFGMAASGGMIPTSYFLPLYIQTVLGANALQSALWMMPTTPTFVGFLILTGFLGMFLTILLTVHTQKTI